MNVYTCSCSQPAKSPANSFAASPFAPKTALSAVLDFVAVFFFLVLTTLEPFTRVVAAVVEPFMCVVAAGAEPFMCVVAAVAEKYGFDTSDGSSLAGGSSLRPSCVRKYARMCMNVYVYINVYTYVHVDIFLTVYVRTCMHATIRVRAWAFL